MDNNKPLHINLETLPAVLCTGILDVVNRTRFSEEQK